MLSRSTDSRSDSSDLFADAPATRHFVDSARSVILRGDASAHSCRQSINPYRGCEHGCIYCDARPAHTVPSLSPGSDFETGIFHRPDAARQLRRELSKPDYRCSPLAIGTDTDAYQPAERHLLLTRGVLEVLYDLRHPATLSTRSALIVRDVDLLAAMARSNLVQVTIALSTLNDALARKLEPRAATPQARLDTIRRLSEAGIPVGVMFAPAIPGLTDQEVDAVLAAAFDAGARTANHAVLRLPHQLHAPFDQWLAWHAPGKVSRIMAILYAMRGGQRSNPRLDSRMRGLEHFAGLFGERFRLACRQIGFSDLPELDCSQFRAMPMSGENDGDGDNPAVAQGLLF